MVFDPIKQFPVNWWQVWKYSVESAIKSWMSKQKLILSDNPTIDRLANFLETEQAGYERLRRDLNTVTTGQLWHHSGKKGYEFELGAALYFASATEQEDFCQNIATAFGLDRRNVWLKSTETETVEADFCLLKGDKTERIIKAGQYDVQILGIRFRNNERLEFHKRFQQLDKTGEIRQITFPPNKEYWLIRHCHMQLRNFTFMQAAKTQDLLAETDHIEQDMQTGHTRFAPRSGSFSAKVRQHGEPVMNGNPYFDRLGPVSR